MAEPEAGAPGCCTIRVRMPGGANESRRFLESHAMSVLYDWVDSLEQAGEPRMSVLYDWVDSLEQAGESACAAYGMDFHRWVG